MAFTAPTLTAALATLSERLTDPLNVRWTLPELTIYLQEAIRTWSAWTACYRDRGTVDLTIAQTFFDLPTVLPALRGQTVTAYDLITAIEYHLLEPATPGTWTGSDQFDLTRICQALQRRRDRFIQETGAVLTVSQVDYTVTATGRYALDEAIQVIRHASWKDTATQLALPLLRTDEWSAQMYAPTTWPQPARPRWYSTAATPPLEMQVIPPPPGDGTATLVTLNNGAAITPGTDVVLGIPDDWAWVVKWGTLADLLQQDGLSLDPARAAYAEARWNEGIQLAKTAPVILVAKINNQVFRQLASLADADYYSPTWALITGVPTRLVTAGMTLMASWPPAGGGGPYTALLDLVINAPIPTVGGDVLQVTQPQYDAILDYAQHLALVKEGPGQLDTSTALLQRAMAGANIDANLQQAAQPSRRPLLGQTDQDQAALPQAEAVLAQRPPV